jgi:hypothetical protein
MDQLHVDVGELCANLMAAVGLDPETNQGFTLTVSGGQIPQLEVHPLPPMDEVGFLDPWSGPLSSAMIGTAMAVLPGSNTQAPPVQLRPMLLPSDMVPAEAHPDHMALRVLVAMADVLNGAGCYAPMRDWLTATAHLLAGVLEARVYAAADAARQRAADPEGA